MQPIIPRRPAETVRRLPPFSAPTWKMCIMYSKQRLPHTTEQPINTVAARWAVTRQQYMRLTTSNLEPSAGYIGKKTLKRNKPIFMCTAILHNSHTNSEHSTIHGEMLPLMGGVPSKRLQAHSSPSHEKVSELTGCTILQKLTKMRTQRGVMTK